MIISNKMHFRCRLPRRLIWAFTYTAYIYIFIYIYLYIYMRSVICWACCGQIPRVLLSVVSLASISVTYAWRWVNKSYKFTQNWNINIRKIKHIKTTCKFYGTSYLFYFDMPDKDQNDWCSTHTISKFTLVICPYQFNIPIPSDGR